nr:MAG: hypothetical protein [Salisharnavirus sp.]
MPTDRETRSFTTPDDLTTYFRDLDIDDDYYSNWQGVLNCESDSTSSWTNVKHKKKVRDQQLRRELKRLNEAAQNIPDFDYLSSLELEGFTDIKGANAEKFGKKRGGRKNVKEQKRLQAKMRVKSRNERLAKNIQPHGLEDDFPDYHDGPCATCGKIGCMDHLGAKRELPHLDFSDEDSSLDYSESEISETFEHEPAERDLRREERNQLARLAIETPAGVQPEESEELSDLISSIQIPDELDGEEGDMAMDWLSYLENLTVLGYQIGRASSFTDIFVAVIGYIKMHSQKSVIKQVLQLIDDVTKKCPKSEVIPEAWEADDVLQKWELFRTNTIFTKISYLISAAMSLTVCNVKEIEWSPFGLQLVSIEAAKTQLKAVDVIDALINTFTWMAQVGYRVFQEKSLMPLLYADNKMQKFNEDCDFVLAHAEQVLAGNGMNVQDFEHKTDDVLRQVSELKSVKSSGPTAIWLQQRYSQLIDIKYKIIAKHRNTAIRFAPFGVGLTGPSGVGKSTLSKLVMKTALNAMEFDTDPKRIITKDMFDKYDSTYTSDILGMFMDDVGNGKSQFAQVSPTDVIIKFFNNMAAQAVKAELNAKGVVFIAFKVGVLTSNFEDYEVRCYTNKPEAALRRFIHTRVRVKPEYRIQGGVSLNTDHPDLEDCDLCKDVWELDLEECHIYETKEGEETYKFRILDVTLPDGTTVHCKNLDLPTYLDAIIALAKKHKKKQSNVVNRSQAFDDMAMCKTCCRPLPLCKCKVGPASCEVDPHGFEQLGDIVVDAAKKSVSGYINKWLSPVNFLNSLCGYRPVKSMATRQLAGEMTHILNATATPWLVSLTPDWLFRTSVFQKSIELWQHSAAMYDLKKQMKFGSMLGTGCVCLGLVTRDRKLTGCALGGSWLFSMGMWAQYRARIRHYRNEYMHRRDALPECAKEARDGFVTKGAFVVSSLVVGLKLFQMWNKNRLSKKEKLDPAGLTREEIENSPGWFGFMMKNLGVQIETSESSKRAHPSHLISTLEKSNLFWAEFHRADGSKTQCNIFFPRKSVAWFPQHVFYKNSDMHNNAPTSLLTVKVFRHNRPGGEFTFKCEFDTCSKTDELDLVCAYVPNCPDLKNKLKWLPLTAPKGQSLATFVVREKDEVKTERLAVEHGYYGHKYKDFYGGAYTSQHAKIGACMGPIVLEQKDPAIVGFHIGGNPAVNYGVMQTITRAQADKLISDLDAMPGVCISADSEDIPETQYGKKILESKDVHPHCMASKLDSKAYVDVLGSTKQRTMQKSQVQKSILSDAVKEVTGVENKWGPPQLIPNWKGYNATLEHIVNPADMFAPSELERARQDWMKPLKEAMKEYVKTEDFRPMTLKESILGVPGKRFLDALKMNTGMGFPVFGPKSKYFEEIRDGEVLIDRIPSDIVQKEMARVLDCWKRGVRAYPVTTATLKDEPTPLEKEKVRVFQAAAVALSIYIRMYFLPVARFLSLHPLLSESAVGINAFSDEWETLMGHANKYADDNKVIAWDYSKYDVRMNSQVTRAVFLSFIELAEVGGYDEESLRIMRNMIVDIVHPLIDYNGTLLMAYNMNTSGNNVTVNVNSTAGSFYVRMGFFNVYPNERDFRKCVAAMTYGDDFKGSVHQDFREFDFFSFQKYLADHGMKVTLPDKSDDAVSFMEEKDADFLKRKSVFIPEINTSIGCLDESSIFKSLHCNLKSKKTLPETVAVSCIETAMHEWFAHGREHYEMRAKQMQEVCRKVNLPVPAAYTTFDERVENWLYKYKSS